MLLVINAIMYAVGGKDGLGTSGCSRRGEEEEKYKDAR